MTRVNKTVEWSGGEMLKHVYIYVYVGPVITCRVYRFNVNNCPVFYACKFFHAPFRPCVLCMNRQGFALCAGTIRASEYCRIGAGGSTTTCGTFIFNRAPSLCQASPALRLRQRVTQYWLYG